MKEIRDSMMDILSRIQPVSVASCASSSFLRPVDRDDKLIFVAVAGNGELQSRCVELGEARIDRKWNDPVLAKPPWRCEMDQTKMFTLDRTIVGSEGAQSERAIGSNVASRSDCTSLSNLLELDGTTVKRLSVGEDNPAARCVGGRRLLAASAQGDQESPYEDDYNRRLSA
jgi:hypothetical protein